jgi:hypothetical protein
MVRLWVCIAVQAGTPMTARGDTSRRGCTARASTAPMSGVPLPAVRDHSPLRLDEPAQRRDHPDEAMLGQFGSIAG